MNPEFHSLHLQDAGTGVFRVQGLRVSTHPGGDLEVNSVVDPREALGEGAQAPYGEHGVVGFVVEGEERGFSTFKASRETKTVVAGEGGLYSGNPEP